MTQVWGASSLWIDHSGGVFPPCSAAAPTLWDLLLSGFMSTVSIIKHLQKVCCFAEYMFSWLVSIFWNSDEIDQEPSVIFFISAQAISLFSVFVFKFEYFIIYWLLCKAPTVSHNVAYKGQMLVTLLVSASRINIGHVCDGLVKP